ncbi:MAG TPA: hypothetical protein PLS07_00800 [Niabella sp.]|nr:hypothetical protein [Niabella sp.]HQW14908.1 hypothetical protein [Niabella sp.]HQX18467.1 hypothetical protein [Niabella sp.]HRB05994.1 hypothetical protein [Niabella sp.]HRB36870.1 hypothetical protein [Niabella sp.]
MSKNTKKPVRRDRMKAEAAYWVAEKFEVTVQYVYGILNGQHTAGRFEEIRKAWQKKYDELKAVTR